MNFEDLQIKFDIERVKFIYIYISHCKEWLGIIKVLVCLGDRRIGVKMLIFNLGESFIG